MLGGALPCDPDERMARPKKHPDEARSEWLPAMRVTPAERMQAEEQALDLCLSLSDYGRQRILGHRIRSRRASVHDALLLELNRIGVNLNQIARAANSGQRLPDDLPAAIEELRAAITKIVDMSE